MALFAAIALGFLVLADLAVLLFGFVEFDRIVRALHDRHAGAWAHEGEPKGFFWYPPEWRGWRRWSGGGFRSGLAFQRACFVWLFRTPEWARGDEGAQRSLRRWRVCVLIWNLTCIPLIAGLGISLAALQ